MQARARTQRRHPKARVPVAAAQAAAPEPPIEATRDAATEVMGGLNKSTEETRALDRLAFKQALRQKLLEVLPQPRSLEHARQIMTGPGAAQASTAMRGELVARSDEAQGPLPEAATTPPDLSQHQVPPPPGLKPPARGRPPPPVDPTGAVPPPAPESRFDVSAERAEVEGPMAEEGVTETQLARANEPSFGAALESHREAEAASTENPARYRQEEAVAHDAARGEAAGLLARGLAAMHEGRRTALGEVGAEQEGTRSRDAAARKKITADIEGFRSATQKQVQGILERMQSAAALRFESGLQAAHTKFDEAYEREDERITDSYTLGSVGRGVLNFFRGGVPKHEFDQMVAAGRSAYDTEVEGAIDAVADIVAAGLGAARAAIAAGWARVEGYVQGLDPAVQEIGREAQKRVEDDFRGMVDAIEEKRDALLDGLAQSYRSSQERLNERIEELWADSRSLWEKAKALIRRVIQTLRRLKDLLFSVLRRLVEVVAAILQDPIGFLGNLVRGVGAGLSRFRARILDHLREGVLRWLFGALQGAGVQLPQQFDAKGIFGLILQLLQLTYAGIRARAVRLLGEPVVARLEQVAEFFRVLATEGPAGLWRMLQEKVEAIKETVLGQIREFVAERIVRAGIEWILGLLTPVGAFIKACQGIYRIVMFFVERGQQLVELVEAVLGALGAIIGGNLAAMANAVENALVRALPVAIGLLASLIGLGGIGERVRTIFQRVRAPVERAIDWLVGQAARLLGRGRQEPTRAAPEGSQALKAEVVATLERELGGEQKAEDAQRIVASIERRYRPSGLRRLFVGPPRDDGSAPVIAETSPGDEVAALTLGGAVKGHKPSVRANIELTLRAPPGAGGAGLPMQTTGATTHPVGTLPEIGRHGRGEASQAAYFLPAVSETAESRTPGNLAVGGIVLPSSGTRIHVVTFSTSSLDLEKRENESHAERQFERWLETLARDPNGSLLLANIKKIEIHLREYSPCGMCTDSLVRIRKMLPNAEVAELYWYKLYTGASPTSWQSLRAIQNARWRLHAPPSAMPPEKSSWGNVFVYLVSKVRGRRR